MGGLAVTCFCSWLFNEYRKGSFQSFFSHFHIGLPSAAVVSALWIFYTEWRLGPEDDPNRHFGLLVLGRVNEVNCLMIRQALLGWFVKGFFLPANVTWMIYMIGQFRGREAEIL